MMTLKIILPDKITEIDKIILRLAEFLIDKFENQIVRVERFEGWDGSNIRIVVKDIGLLEEIIKAIGEFEARLGITGTIVPRIVSEDEFNILPKHVSEMKISDDLVLRLRQYLNEKFGDEIVRVERFEGWDGSNIRIVVKDIGLLEEIIKAIGEFEARLGITGTIVPRIVSEDETDRVC